VSNLPGSSSTMRILIVLVVLIFNLYGLFVCAMALRSRKLKRPYHWCTTERARLV
jgi:hypothetical protein